MKNKKRDIIWNTNQIRETKLLKIIRLLYNVAHK